jgi:RecB family endonuclease NucS
LALGDYLILLRDQGPDEDSSVLVLSASRGLNPRNWMPAGSRILETASGYTIEHQARGERLDIYIDQVHWEMQALSELEGELTKMGAEREFSDLVATHLNRVSESLTLISREARTPAGPVDLLCVEDTGCPVVIEVKRQRITPADCWQCLRYLHSVHAMAEWRERPPPRGIMLAPVLAKKAKEVIDTHPQLSFVRLSYADLRYGAAGKTG